MSARTLRLLVTFGAIFAAFIYVFSNQLVQVLPAKSPEEGKLGGPIPGLTGRQLTRFEEGRALFNKKFTLKEGLGPLYNAVSCAECHGQASTASGATTVVPRAEITRFARRKQPGNPGANMTAGATATAGRSPEVAFKDVDQMVNEGGPVLLSRSITDLADTGLSPDCRLKALPAVPPQAEFHGKRIAQPLYGLGLIEAIPDPVLLYNKVQQERSCKETAGHAVEGPVITSSSHSLGRFGARAQENSVLGFVARDMGLEIGISNPLFKHTLTPAGIDRVPECLKAICPPDPNDNGKILAKINFYLQTLAPPPRGPLTPEAQKGDAVFTRAGCAVCHIKQLPTLPKVFILDPDLARLESHELPAPGNTLPDCVLSGELADIELRALENKTVMAYSDFLVHKMGAALADGTAEPGTTGGEWRTAPLWGLHLRKVYLHDGRAKSIDEAIRLHGGQGTSAAKTYAALRKDEKSQLLAFLNSL